MEVGNSNPEREKKLAAIKSQTANFIGLAIVFVVLGFAAAGLGAWSSYRNGNALSLNSLAALGSFLQGSVASLWSLAGLLFIYVAFLGQREQLIKQDQELEDQQAQFRQQFESIKQQNFESTFFQMLNLQNQLTASIKYGDHRGRECFSYIRSGFPSDFDQWLRRTKGLQNPLQHFSDESLTRGFCDSFFKQHQSEFAHYFRNLYHVFKLVKYNGIEPKRRYASLARAQLSNFELLFLFYNCLSSDGKNFKPLVEEFGLLEHLDDSLLLDLSHKKFFQPGAFQ